MQPSWEPENSYRICTKGNKKGIKMFPHKKNQLNTEDSNAENEGQNAL